MYRGELFVAFSFPAVDAFGPRRFPQLFRAFLFVLSLSNLREFDHADRRLRGMLHRRERALIRSSRSEVDSESSLDSEHAEDFSKAIASPLSRRQGRSPVKCGLPAEPVLDAMEA